MNRTHVCVIALLATLSMTVEVAAAPAADAPPRAANGRLDLTGVWSNASLTWLERPATLKGRMNTPAIRATMP